MNEETADSHAQMMDTEIVLPVCPNRKRSQKLGLIASSWLLILMFLLRETYDELFFGQLCFFLCFSNLVNSNDH